MPSKLRQTECGLLMFHCVPCGHSHGVPTKQYPHKYPEGASWDFNRSFESPTFTPSVKVSSVDKNLKPTVCHFYVRDGRIEYLNDCTHELRGQTVDMLDINKE